MTHALLTLADFEERAGEIMPRVVWEQIVHGSMDEISTQRIRPAFDAILLRPRALSGVTDVDLSTTALGNPIAFPFGASAPGQKHHAHPDGERATARAATGLRTIYIAPHVALYTTSTIEDIAAAASGGGPFWFQAYILTDRGLTEDAVRRAEAAGCSAIVVTVSAPIVDMHAVVARDRDVRNRMELYGAQFDLGASRAARLSSGFVFDRTATWADIEWVASLTSLPVIVKGVVRADDARLARSHGAAAIVVSTHAARLFDGPITTIEALPGVVAEVGDECEVYVDGGIRRGTDILKALALGARACLIGKPLFYGLAVDGEVGVRRVFGVLRREFELAMRLCGVRSIAEIDESLVARPELRLLDARLRSDAL